MTEVASTVQYGERRSQTPDSIDRELDWMINRDPHSSSNQYDEPQNTHGADQTSPNPAQDKPTDFYEQRDHFDRDDMASPEPKSGANHTEESQKSYSPTPVDHHGHGTGSKSQSPPSSPSRSPSRSPPSSPTSQTQSDTDQDPLAMTESQQQADAELDTMKLDLGYTEEDPPDYDVADRVRQLNEELANDPSPDQDRECSIKFKENLVDLVAPPPDLPSDDEETDDQAKRSPRDIRVSTDQADEKVDDDEETDNNPRQTKASTYKADKHDKNVDDSPRETKASTNKVDEKVDDSPRETKASTYQADEKVDSPRETASSGQNTNATSPRDQTPSPDVTESHRKSHAAHEPVDSGDESEEDSPRKDDSAAENERDYSNESGDDATPRSPRATDSNRDSSRGTSRDDKILVERNGKFELLNANEMTAEERELYCVPEPEEHEEDESEAKNGKHEPKPPSQPRPRTTDTGGSRKSNHGSQRRSQSAQGYNEWDENFTYASPYAMTPEYRRELAKKRQKEQRKEKEERDKNDKDQEQKSKDNNDAFEGWLRKKKEQIRQENQEKGKDAEQEEEEEDPERAYEDWNKSKKEESKKQKEDEKKRQKECDEGWYVRPREDCDKAFKQWLSKKNADTKKQKNDEKQKARIHKLLARRSRKSQQLARAIRQAQAYRYVDYYGYRF